jgi:hypothetical protein|uniref:Uncharacterized protein n=1 Tax=Fagus sylvatica TaxID=28930 RepID=A0A2N9FG39_FAGSY
MERESETVTAEDSSSVEGGLEATIAWRVAWKQRQRGGWLGSNDSVEGGLEATAAQRVAWKQRRREVAWIGG